MIPAPMVAPPMTPMSEPETSMPATPGASPE
jgi:hypothetical protein